MKKTVALFVFAFLFSCLMVPASGKNQGEKLLVFVEETRWSVEQLLSGAPFCRAVASPEEAQVIISINEESKPGEKIRLAVLFTGQKELAGETNSLSLELPEETPPERILEELSRLIKLGLVPLVGKTPLASKLRIRFLEEVKPTDVVDKWKFWVFSLSMNSFGNLEKSYSYRNLYGNFSASRVTPEWKFRLSFSGSLYQSSFDYGEIKLTSTSKSGSVQTLIAKSLGEHWSVGAFVHLRSSTYSNIRFGAKLSPAVEYNFFPYSQSTSRQLRLTYSPNLGPNFYYEETIFEKTKEFLTSQSASLTLELKRKWGTISTSLEASHYFHDFSKYRLELSTDLSLRIYRGLSMNLYGNVSRIHDQLFLSRGGASWEEVLLMRKQLATSYSYYFSFGLSYSFGSIFSRVVNPRFGSGTSGISISMSY